MRTRHDSLSRREISERIDRCAEAISDTQDSLREAADDGVVVSDTLDTLDLSITDECGNAVKGHLCDARDIAVEHYEDCDGQLDRLHEDSTKCEEDISDRIERGEVDDKILAESRENARIHEILSHIDHALDAIRSELSLLAEPEKRIHDVRTQSEHVRADMRNRMSGVTRK